MLSMKIQIRCNEMYSNTFCVLQRSYTWVSNVTYLGMILLIFLEILQCVKYCGCVCSILLLVFGSLWWLPCALVGGKYHASFFNHCIIANFCEQCMNSILCFVRFLDVSTLELMPILLLELLVFLFVKFVIRFGGIFYRVDHHLWIYMRSSCCCYYFKYIN